jgi:Protein of unknown function (DUF3617)
MKEDAMRTIMSELILLSSVAVWAGDKVQPLNVKVGLWETTMTATTSGAMPIPPEVLSRLTPEQRARMEERMKANSTGKTRTNTYKNCLTKEKLEKGPLFGEEQKECTQTVVTSTSSKTEVRVACENENMKSSGTIQVEALSPENVKGSGQMSVSGGGHTMNSNTTFTAKWIGPVCGDVK